MAAANQHCGEDDGNKISAEFLRLLKTDSNTTILNDADSLNDCELVTTGDGDNDVVLHVVVQIADDEWESVDVVSTNLEDAAVS